MSSRGGVHGYHTFGEQRDPLTGEVRVATPVAPVPYAGGTLAEQDAPSRLVHNSYRPDGAEADIGADLAASGFAAGELVYTTEESFNTACTSDGRFVIASLEGSFGGEGFTSTPAEPFRLETVGVWSPALQEGAGPVALCSAHYFDMRHGLVAYSWYGQGTRFLDVSDPTAPLQVAYWRPLVNTSFAPYFHGEAVFVADSVRGIGVLRLTPEAVAARATRTEVVAPPLRVRAATTLDDPVTIAGRTFGPDPVYGYSCWLPRGAR